MTTTTALTFRGDVLVAKAAAAGDTTMLAIAQRSGVRESTVSRLLAGRHTPTLPTVVAFAVAYKTTLDDLVQWPGQRPAVVVPGQRSEVAT